MGQVRTLQSPPDLTLIICYLERELVKFFLFLPNKGYFANLLNKVVGIYNPAFDKTRRKIAERRMLTLREIGERTAAARDLKGFWSQVIKGLEFNGMSFL